MGGAQGAGGWGIWCWWVGHRGADGWGIVCLWAGHSVLVGGA